MQKIIKITDFGADETGKTLSTEAIKKAIVSGKGGTVIFPKGKFISGSLELTDDTIYMFEKGCILCAASLSNFYKIGYNHNEMKEVTSFLWAIGKKNITLCGEGTIEFGAHEYYNSTSEVICGQMYKKNETRLNQPIFFDHCSNIRVENLTFTDSPCWTLTFSETDGISVSDITIQNNRMIPNSDGIHLSASRNALIRRCRICGGDDSIALTCITNKSGVNRNISISDCELSSNSAAIRIGHNVDNVNIERIKILNSNRGIGIFTADKTKISNVTIKDVELNTRPLNKCWWGNGDSIVIAAPQSESQIRNIAVSNIYGTAGNGLIIFGNALNINNVILSDINLNLRCDGNNLLDLRPYHSKELHEKFISHIIRDSQNVSLENVNIRHSGGYSEVESNSELRFDRVRI